MLCEEKMKSTDNIIIQFKTIYVFFIIIFVVGCSKTSEVFQKDADIIRLRHLKYYGELLKEYNKITGKYPFQEQKDVPIYVHVANDEQIEFTTQGPPYPHETIPFKEFVEEIEEVLGKEICEYYDPQYRPDYKPNFYIYMVTGDTYFFAINVHQPFTFAKKVADHYYKIEISNHPNSQNQAVRFEQLLNSTEFNAKLNEPISKEDFFKERERKYLHYTKTFD